MPGRIQPTGRIGSKSIEIDASCSISCPVEFEIRPVEFDHSTGRIWCKSIQITLPVKGHTISVNLHNLHPI